MLYVETNLNSQKSATLKVLLSIDEYNQLIVEKIQHEQNSFKILNHDALTKTTSQLADFINGKYVIYNPSFFNQYYLKPLKDDKRMLKELQSFMKADYDIDGFKRFDIKFKCFKRRFNISITKFFRKTKNGIKKHAPIGF